MLARIRKSIEDNDEGFTLIELLVVIIIIGILAAIAIPVFLNQRQKGYDAQVKSDLRNAATAEETYLSDYTTGYTTSTSALNLEGWVQSPNDLTFSIQISPTGATAGYCLEGKSSSGHDFYYDSQAGGLNGTANALPANAVACVGMPAL